METGKVNYESDFKLPVEPKEIPNLSASPFELVFYTRKSVNKYVASYDGTKYTNCYPTSDGGLVVVFDNHNLGCGTMWCDVHLPLTDKDFKDGICNYRSTEPTGVLLHKGATDDVRGLKMDIFPFYQQGADGKSAYDLWVEEGNDGTVADFLASIKGEDGANGKSAYQEWLDLGNEGSEEDFLESLKGQGVEIVSSVNDLDPNAPQGSLAVVVTDNVIQGKRTLRDSYYKNESPIYIGEIQVTSPTSPLLSNTGETPLIIASKGFDNFSDCLGSGKPFAALAYYDGSIIGASSEETEFPIMSEGVIDESALKDFNSYLSTVTDAVFYGAMSWVGEGIAVWVEPTEDQWSDLEMLFGYVPTGGSNSTELYIKEVDGWKLFKTGSDVVNNLEDGGEDKALSAEMGKFLNEKIANIISGTTTDPIKFKGYVNVENKDGIDRMFSLLSEGEACLVAPSVKFPEEGLTEDSYLPWIASAMEGGEFPLSEDLLKISGLDAYGLTNIMVGKGEVKTYFKLDAEHPYWTCPDMLLLAKVKVNVKQFSILIPELQAVQSLILSSLKMTVCIGKVLRWSGGDWIADNKVALERSILSHRYGWGYNMDEALETGIIAYTDKGGSTPPINNGGWYTVFVNASTDTDHAGAYTVQQTAYGRTGDSTNRVWTRVLFVKDGNIVNRLPWAEISNNNNILPNVNGWLLNPDEQLTTGVYQTCNSAGTGLFTNNYFTMFVNASTTPNADGWDAIEQTAYGREADEGKIYRRVIFYHRENKEIQFKEWKRIDDGATSNALEEFGSAIETYITENLITKDDLQQAIQDKMSSVTLTAIESISEEEYNSKFADGTLSSTTMYVIV